MWRASRRRRRQSLPRRAARTHGARSAASAANKERARPSEYCSTGSDETQTGYDRKIVRLVLASVRGVVTPFVREVERSLEPEQVRRQCDVERERIDESARAACQHEGIENGRLWLADRGSPMCRPRAARRAAMPQRARAGRGESSREREPGGESIHLRDRSQRSARRVVVRYARALELVRALLAARAHSSTPN